MFGYFRGRQCRKMRRVLSDYIDERLTPSEQRMVEHHLDVCEGCRRELHSLRATVDLLHLVPIVSPSRSFALTRVEPVPRPATFVWLRAATAFATLLLVFLFVGDILSPSGGFPLPQGMLLRIAGEPGQFTSGDSALITGGPTLSLWQLELALLVVVAILGGATALVWRKGSKGGAKGV